MENSTGLWRKVYGCISRQGDATPAYTAVPGLAVPGCKISLGCFHDIPIRICATHNLGKLLSLRGSLLFRRFGSKRLPRPLPLGRARSSTFTSQLMPKYHLAFSKSFRRFGLLTGQRCTRAIREGWMRCSQSLFLLPAELKRWKRDTNTSAPDIQSKTLVVLKKLPRSFDIQGAPTQLPKRLTSLGSCS